MSTENLNNIPNWKVNLDALDNLPGDTTYDKSVAWEKLHVRLGDNKRSTIKAWYWVAAACIFFALLIPLFYSESNNQHNTNSALNEHQPSIITPSDHKAPITNLAVTDNEKKFPAPPTKTMAKLIHENKKEKLRLSYTVISKSIIPETESNFMTPLETLSSLATIQPEKKKLKVVHINELGDPIQTLPEIVKNSDKHAFQFKIADQGIYINPATASNTSGFTILKIRSSQN